MNLGSKAYYYLASVTVFLIGGGTVFYHYVEDLSWVDAYYFCMITLTTVGYGDIAPKTNAGKIFTTFYLIFGIGIITTFITTIAKRRGKKMAERHQRRQPK